MVSTRPGNSTFSAEVYYEADGVDCGKATSSQAQSGSVVVTQPDTGNGIVGTFDLIFDTYNHVTGSFSSATLCSTRP